MTATEARAADIVAAAPQELFATADITPVLYFGFLTASLSFAVGTVSYPPSLSSLSLSLSLLLFLHFLSPSRVRFRSPSRSACVRDVPLRERGR